MLSCAHSLEDKLWIEKWNLVCTAPELKGWKPLLGIDGFGEAWRSGQMSSFDITAVCWKYGFSRGVRAVKIRIFPHLSFFSLSWVFSLFFCRVPVSALCSCWVLLEFLGWLLQDLLHLELLIHFHLVIAESLLPSSVWLGFFWVFLFFFFFMETWKSWVEQQRLQTLWNPPSRTRWQRIHFSPSNPIWQCLCPENPPISQSQSWGHEGIVCSSCQNKSSAGTPQISWNSKISPWKQFQSAAGVGGWVSCHHLLSKLYFLLKYDQHPFYQILFELKDSEICF